MDIEKGPLPAKKPEDDKKDADPKKKPPNTKDNVSLVTDPILGESGDYKRPYKLDNPSEKRIEYFIPTTICLVMKSIDNLEKMQVHLVFTLIIRCNLDGFDAETQEWIKDNLKVRLNEEEHDIGSNRKLTSGKLSVTHRGSATVYFNPNFRQLPFDIQELPIKLEMTSIFNPVPKPAHNYRFNVLYHRSVTPTMLSWKNDSDRLPEFNVDASGTTAAINLERKDNEAGEAIYVYSPFITYTIRLFREPEHLIISTTLPLMLLNLATLTIFAPGTAYGDKLGVLVTLLLAMFAFIPTLREQIPQVPYTTSLEKQIYICIATLFLAFLESVITQMMTYDDAEGDNHPYFIHSYVLLALSIAVIVISAVVFFVRYTFYKTKTTGYMEPHEVNEIKTQSSSFKWENCDDWDTVLSSHTPAQLKQKKAIIVSRYMQ